MSLQPYVPPTEEEWNALHVRLGRYIALYHAVARAVDLDGEVAEMALANDIEDKVLNTIERIKALRFALGLTGRSEWK